MENWSRVIFTDEAPFHVNSCARRRYVRRRINEAYDSKLTIPPSKRYNLKIMVWGSISVHGVGTLKRFTGNVDKHSYLRLLREVIPRMRLTPNTIWQQDNAPAHSSRIVQQYLTNRRINIMKWPPFSPDLNPIENIWSLLHHRLDLTHIHTADQLWEAVLQQWNSLTRFDVMPFINSMNARCRAVLQSRGAPTKY
jgi:transposase